MTDRPVLPETDPELVARIVMTLYDRVRASPVLAPWFEGVDMRRLVEHQCAFVASALGGAHAQSDPQIAAVHAHLAIPDPAFEEMTRLLAESLVAEGATPEAAARLLGAFERRRALVVAA